MANARFRLNRAGVGELLRSPQMQAAMLRVAEAIKAEAEAIAPVGKPPEDKHPGEYKASFTSSVAVKLARSDVRAVATVANRSPHAAAVEYGNTTGRGGAHHVLLRASLTGARSVLR